MIIKIERGRGIHSFNIFKDIKELKESNVKQVSQCINMYRTTWLRIADF